MIAQREPFNDRIVATEIVRGCGAVGALTDDSVRQGALPGPGRPHRCGVQLSTVAGETPSRSTMSGLSKL